jgi:pyruvate formate lyase activating enzyme
MTIAGLQKFSLIDYPGRTCAILFTRGCQFRCPYCHNPELVLPEKFAPTIPLDYIFAFLEKRRGKLDAVSITGGEPTIHYDLVDFVKKIKAMNFLVKLDSNGSNPEVLEQLIGQKLVDYFAMDIKAPLATYERIACAPVLAEKLQRSISLIMSSRVEYEFRTTIVKDLTSKNDLRTIAKTIPSAAKYFLQRFRPKPGNLIDHHCDNATSYEEEELRELAQELQHDVVFCGVR